MRNRNSIRMLLIGFSMMPVLAFAQTQSEPGGSNGAEDKGAIQEETGKAPPATCTCYCLVGWGAAIAAPYVPNPTTSATVWWPLPPVETETETGDEFWTANTNKKDYNCTTKQVLLVTPDTPNLTHNTYSQTRTRTMGFTGWGAWTAWSGPANTGNLGDAAALATSAPPQTPICTANGVPCP